MNPKDVWTIKNPPAHLAWLFRRWTVASGAESICICLAIRPEETSLAIPFLIGDPTLGQDLNDPVSVGYFTFNVDHDNQELILR